MPRPPRITPWFVTATALLVTAAIYPAGALGALSPEADTLAVSKRLKPIADNVWMQIAGARIEEKYTIEKGDTLWDISKKLFGDAYYWPKVWALNNQSITNPHVIRPGRAIAFMPGTGNSLPAVALADASGTPGEHSPERMPEAPPSSPELARGSQEYKLLPRQSWEEMTVRRTDKDTVFFDFDRSKRVKSATTIELEKIVASDGIEPIGRIFGSTSEGSYLGLGDEIFVRATGAEALRVGSIYSITDVPGRITGEVTGRRGYAYAMLGEVQIERAEDDGYVARVVHARGIISRGAVLIPYVAKIKNLTPIAAKQEVEGSIVLDRYFSTYQTAQNKFAFVDRGSLDGVEIGNVFRAYLRLDPATKKRLLNGDITPYADFIVVQVTDRFCTTLALNSNTAVDEKSSVLLLTDISSLLRKNKTNIRQIENGGDDLDQLGGSDTLGKDEEKELKQLEQWKGNPEEDPANAIETAPPPPSDSQADEENVPPPPAEGEVPPPQDAPTPQEEATPPLSEEVAPPPAADSAIEPDAAIDPGIPGAPGADEELPPPPPPEEFEPPKPARKK